MTDNSQKLLDTYDTASRKVKDSSKSNGVDEKMYAIAYQNLVKAGLAMQLRKKYR